MMTRGLILLPAVVALLVAVAPAQNAVISDIHEIANYNPVDGIDAIAVGVVACNVGGSNLDWNADTGAHPIVGQSLYRYDGDRFEMIGQSWAAHPFLGVGGAVCGTCVGGSTVALGTNCSNTISAALMGFQDRLGPKSDVDPVSGAFPYPATNQSLLGDAIYKRLQFATADVDPANFPGAKFYVETQVISAADAAAMSSSDNASWREVEFTGGPNNFVCSLAPGSTTEPGSAGVNAWRQDTAVSVTLMPDMSGGRFALGLRTEAGMASTYSYELALQNVDSRRGARRVRVDFSAGANITGIGFHDASYHSGELYDDTDWAVTVGSDYIEWSTTDFATDPDANALRWGAIYNFRFTSDILPLASDPIHVTVELFEPGSPATIDVNVIPLGAFTIVGGQNEGGNINEQFPKKLAVQVLDALSAPLAGVAIQFAQTSGPAVTLSNGGIGVSNANGVADVTVTGGPATGPITVEADSGQSVLTFNNHVRRLNRIWVPSGILIMQITSEFISTPVILAFDFPPVTPTSTPYGTLCTSILNPGPGFGAKSGYPSLPLQYCPSIITTPIGSMTAVFSGLAALNGSGLTVNHQAYIIGITAGEVRVMVSNCITATY